MNLNVAFENVPNVQRQAASLVAYVLEFKLHVVLVENTGNITASLMPEKAKNIFQINLCLSTTFLK